MDAINDGSMSARASASARLTIIPRARSRDLHPTHEARATGSGISHMWGGDFGEPRWLPRRITIGTELPRAPVSQRVSLDQLFSGSTRPPSDFPKRSD